MSAAVDLCTEPAFNNLKAHVWARAGACRLRPCCQAQRVLGARSAMIPVQVKRTCGVRLLVGDDILVDAYA